MQSIASASDEVEERHPAGDTSDPADTAWQPSSFDAMGRRAWGFIGIAVVTVAIYAVLTALSGLVVPLVIAVVLGMLFVPLVDKLAQWMARQLAAIIVMRASTQ